jgi:hypothetical protein
LLEVVFNRVFVNRGVTRGVVQSVLDPFFACAPVRCEPVPFATRLAQEFRDDGGFIDHSVMCSCDHLVCLLLVVFSF